MKKQLLILSLVIALMGFTASLFKSDWLFAVSFILISLNAVIDLTED